MWIILFSKFFYNYVTIIKTCEFVAQVLNLVPDIKIEKEPVSWQGQLIRRLCLTKTRGI